MLVDGISVTGNYHDNNQDSYSYTKIKNGYAVAVSDGLGSKKNSKIGSSVLCDSVIENVHDMECDLLLINPEDFVKRVYLSWKDKLKEYDITQCYATMLLFVMIENRLFAARLGDGFISISADEVIKVLFDRKSTYFVNETDCLTEEFNADKLEIYEMEFQDFNGAVLCSDGVEIGNMAEDEIISFTREFIDGYNTMSKTAVSEDIHSWISDWTGSDDKTLAYIISERRLADEGTI